MGAKIILPPCYLDLHEVWRFDRANFHYYFFEHGFDAVEKFNNYIKFESKSVAVTLAYDSREHWLYMHAGHKNGLLSELNPDVLKNVFGEDIKNQTIEEIMDFFKGKGAKILFDDSELLNKLEAYTRQRSKEFTEEIIRFQNLKSADFAWQNKDYQKFIKCIELIDKNTLLDSYKKKYKIALKKLQQL